MALWEDPEEGILDEAPVTGSRGDRGLKPIPEDAMRPSMSVRNGSGGALNGEVIEFMLCKINAQQDEAPMQILCLTGTALGQSWMSFSEVMLLNPSLECAGGQQKDI